MTQATQPTLSIMPYSAVFSQEVGRLITSVQHEFGIPITYEDQPDLQNIEHVYQSGAGNFWIALDQDRVVGTIALIDRGQQTGVLRKMFVHPDYRGASVGLGKKLLDTLTDWAGVHALQDIYLGTCDNFAAARRFYEKNGFTLIENDALPLQVASIRMAVDNRHYHKRMQPPATGVAA